MKMKYGFMISQIFKEQQLLWCKLGTCLYINIRLFSAASHKELHRDKSPGRSKR